MVHHGESATPARSTSIREPAGDGTFIRLGHAAPPAQQAVQPIPIGDPMTRNTLAVAFACTLLSAGQLRAADAVDHAQLKKAHKEMEAQHREMETGHKKMEAEHARWRKQDKRSRRRKPDDAHVKIEKE